MTDINGETHTGEQMVSVGYAALLADVMIPSKLDLQGKNTFRISTTNMNGKPVPSTGTISIYRLKTPDRVMHPRPWARPDVFVMTMDQFYKDFPNEIFDREDRVDNWEKLQKVGEFSFNTEKDTILLIADLNSWIPGEYRVELQTKDAFGEPVEMTDYFTSFSAESKQVPVVTPDWFTILKDSGEPGETASFLAGTSEKNVWVLYEIVNRGTLISREWKKLNNEQVRFDIPIREEYRGNFAMNMIFIKGNHSYWHQQVIHVPYTNKQLDIVFETFRDKLSPGQEEQWRVKISGKNGDQVAAEFLAGMYDASLDAFRGHSWSLPLYGPVASTLTWNAGDAFGNAYSRHVIKERMTVTRSIAPMTS